MKPVLNVSGGCWWQFYILNIVVIQPFAAGLLSSIWLPGRITETPREKEQASSQLSSKSQPESPCCWAAVRQSPLVNTQTVPVLITIRRLFVIGFWNTAKLTPYSLLWECSPIIITWCPVYMTKFAHPIITSIISLSLHAAAYVRPRVALQVPAWK